MPPSILLRRLIVCTFLIFYATCGYCEKTILVLGDSLSAGFRLQRNESWVDLLAQHLESDSSEFTVVNASVSGASTMDGLNTLPNLLEEYKPNIVIIALGSNDGLRGTPLIVTQNNLGKLINISEDANAKVLLIGFQLPPQFGKAYTKGFSEIFTKLSKKYDVPLVPFLLAGFETNLNYFQKDKLHPTANAQPIILNNVLPYLQPMLKN